MEEIKVVTEKYRSHIFFACFCNIEEFTALPYLVKVESDFSD